MISRAPVAPYRDVAEAGAPKEAALTEPTGKLVFISYASPDRAIADRVVTELEMNGMPCWIAPRDVPGGSDYAKTIVNAIESCAAFVVLFSASAVSSDHIEREIHLAAGAKRTIVPLRLEPLEPAGSLKYLLANSQWLDAFPRLEPQLARLRDEVRAALLRSGKTIISTTRSPYQRVIVSAVAWTIVLGVDALLLVWMQRRWFNLVPIGQSLGLALRSPGPLLALLAPVAAALGLQYWSHRTLGTIAMLDALFGLRGAGALTRTAGVVALSAALLLATVTARPTLQLGLTGGPVNQDNTRYVRARSCEPDESYNAQSTSHYTVELRTGSLNPTGPYTLRIDLQPYATDDGVEFCEIWLDKSLGVTTVTPIPDDARRAGYVEVTGPIDRFIGDRSVMFTVRYYQEAKPSAQTTARATVASTSRREQRETRIATPLH